MTRRLIILLFVASAFGVLYSNLRDPVATGWMTNDIGQLSRAPEHYRQPAGQVPFATGITSGAFIAPRTCTTDTTRDGVICINPNTVIVRP